MVRLTTVSRRHVTDHAAVVLRVATQRALETSFAAYRGVLLVTCCAAGHRGLEFRLVLSFQNSRHEHCDLCYDVYAAQAIVRKKRELEQELWGGNPHSEGRRGVG